MPSGNKTDEFYIGYTPKAPKYIGRFIIKTTLALLLLTALLAAAFVRGQNSFYPSVFEFLQPRSFTGVISMQPVPMLLAARPGKSGEAAHFSRYYLVAEGKHGAREALHGWEGKPVTLQGKLIYRDNQTMLELVSGSIKPWAVAPARASRPADSTPEFALGTFTLEGEIVDSKCYLGVMNPGNLKTHRACAVRCISGGIPPIFVVRDQNGNAIHLLLVSPDGRTVNNEVLHMVAEPLVISGQIFKQGDLLLLKADPKTYRPR